MRFLPWAVSGLAAVAVAVVAFVNLFSASAREPHWEITTKMLEAARRWSIANEAKDIQVPALGDRRQLVQGVIHYHAHCGVCHGGPGYEPGDIALGMYPPPADLKEVAKRHSPAELFWVVKNGIKMTGMPAWAEHGDEELWPVVALLNAFPTMTPEAYSALVAEGKAGHHSGGETVAPSPPAVEAHHSHGHGAHSHKH